MSFFFGMIFDLGAHN